MSKMTTINEKGKLKVIKDDGKKVVVGNSIIPIVQQTNIDTNVISIFLEFLVDNKKKVIGITRDKLHKAGIRNLTKYGADSWDNVADIYVDDIKNNLSSAKKTYEHSTVGLGIYEDNRIFKLYKGINIDSVYDESKYNIKPMGDYMVWEKMIQKEVLGNQYLEFALVAGFIAPVINIISEENNVESIIINFCGNSSTGKTLATKLALSPWGLPDTSSNGLLKSWYATDQGILSYLTGNFGVPIALDDTSLQENDKDYTQLIYQIVNGQTKTALHIDGTNRRVGEWKTAVLSSSEDSIIKSTDQNKKGILVRIFELKVKQITTSAENAEKIAKVISKNYGHAGVMFAEYLMEQDSASLDTRLEEIRADILSSIDKDSLSDRIARKLAVMQLTGELVREALDIDIDLQKLKETLIEMEEKSIEDRNLSDKAYDSIIEYFQTNMGKFFKDGDTPKDYKESVGKYMVDTSGQITEIRIPKNIFEKIMKRLGYNQESIINEWQRDGYLNCDKGKTTLTRVFHPRGGKINMYAIKIKKVTNVISISKSSEKVEEII